MLLLRSVGSKGGVMPFVERVGGLHVVVGVAEDGGLAGGVQPVGVDERMALGGDDFDVLHADAAQFVGDEVGGFLNVGLVFVEGADAGNAEKIFEFVEKTLLIIAGKIDCWGSHELSPFCVRRAEYVRYRTASRRKRISIARRRTGAEAMAVRAQGSITSAHMRRCI